MRRNQAEGGYALVLLLGIMATLAILAATAVLVLGNQQQATTADSSRTQAFGYAEAGLDSAVMAVRTHSWPSTNGAFAAADLSAAFDATYVSGSRPPLVVRVYDNQATVNTAITWDQGGPSAPSTPDGKLWVEAQVTYKGKTSRVRTLVGQVNSTGSLSLPEAAIYTDANVVNGTGGSGDVYAIKEDGTPDTSKQVGVMARGNFVGNWSSDLKPPSGASGPTIDVRVNGTVYNPAIYHNTNTYPGVGGVEPLSTVFPQSTVDTLTAQAQAGKPTSANAGGTVVDSALLTQLQRTSSQTYNATTDLVVNGNLTLGGGESWFNFRSLYVTGNLTLGGNTHTNTTALYVGGNFTISGPSGISKFGSIYVGGSVNWGGALSVETTDYTDTSKGPGPLYVAGNFLTQGGPFNHNVGPTYVAGSVTISGNNALFLCPILVTPGQITTSGSAAIGSVTKPVLLLGLNDNNGSSKNISLGSNGTFTGLMVNMDGGVTLPGGNGSQTDIIGAIYAVGSVTFGGNTGLCYSPTVMQNLQVTAGTTSTTVVPGTWQELSPEGS